VGSAVEDYAMVRSYRLKEMPWAEVNRATMSIFHIGNNHRFHGPIWQVSQRHAGLSSSMTWLYSNSSLGCFVSNGMIGRATWN
jgi:hypothetical protein